jgi:hypothetical protein
VTRPFLVEFDLFIFHPDFCEGTGLVLLNICHGASNDPSSTFKNKNSEKINQCP